MNFLLHFPKIVEGKKDNEGRGTTKDKRKQDSQDERG